MRVGDGVELPPELQRVLKRAVVLEWVTIGYLLTAIALLAVTLGQSQAMKAAWFEDILSLFPPIAFLVATRIRKRPPDKDHPYGWHRSVNIAYLTAALALLALGSYILLDSLLRLARFEHPPIGMVELFGQPVWTGWLMVGALVYTGLPPVLLGRLKVPLAEALHDKVLYADAEMNRADWLTAGAAMLGVVGIGAGLWWADAVAATVISLDIVRDGFRNLGVAVADLLDRRPLRYDASEAHPLPGEALSAVSGLPWVDAAWVRLREEGHVFVGEVLVVPRAGTPDVPARVEEAVQVLRGLDWRLHDVVVSPVQSIDGPEGVGVRTP